MQLPVRNSGILQEFPLAAWQKSRSKKISDLYGENIITKGQEDSILKIYESIISL